MVQYIDFIEVFIPLFIIINPLAIIPNYVDVIRHLPKKESEKVSNRATLSAFLLLTIFIVIGRPFLAIIGITAASFMIACGLLLLYISLGMLSGDPPITRNVQMDSSSIVPMSIPLLAGPGSIATAIVLEDTYGTLMVFLALALTIFISKILMDKSEWIENTLGKNGLNAWIRLSALFYAAIAISLITDSILIIW